MGTVGPCPLKVWYAGPARDGRKWRAWLQGGCLGRKSTSHRSARYLRLLLDSWPKPVGRGRSDLAAERRLTPVSPTLSSPRRGCATCHLPRHNARPDTAALRPPVPAPCARKIERSGLSQAVGGEVLIFVHKEQELGGGEQRDPAEQYFLG